MKLPIYKTVWKDRHTDDEITVHLTMPEACAELDRRVRAYDPDDAAWEQDAADHVRSANEDGPRGHVEEGELDLGLEVKILVFVAGRFRQVVECECPRDAVVFAQGFCAGIERYEEAALYVMPEDRDEMVRDQPAGEVRMALEAAQIS